MCEWRSGDIAICIKDDWEPSSEDGLLAVSGHPVKGRGYVVSGLCTIDPSDIGLKFRDLPLESVENGGRNHGWSASNFRKATRSWLPKKRPKSPQPLSANA